ncbi:hypothetical protein IGI04_028886 [Brassica rapa subsp. trilocularis]|uniref:Uncharacterized protein n=1 Tax=Brassica rapa subsp. trilocularis TaxID=1813537 RepID=A0ABQ7L649_BRACM|nr:hypothetical protein IGI04_028886 [Brassica rapa subsp. trilocularis]
MPVSSAPSPPRLQSPFIHRPINATPSSSRSLSARNLRSPSTSSYPRIKSEVDTNTVIAISVGVASVALGIGIPVFYETQIDNAVSASATATASMRTVVVRFEDADAAAYYIATAGFIGVSRRTQRSDAASDATSCVNLRQRNEQELTQNVDAAAAAEKCRLCVGSGNVTVELGGGEKEVSSCINCDGAGSLTCTTCQGSGVQPRYLDRREFKDDD